MPVGGSWTRRREVRRGTDWENWSRREGLQGNWTETGNWALEAGEEGRGRRSGFRTRQVAKTEQDRSRMGAGALDVPAVAGEPRLEGRRWPAQEETGVPEPFKETISRDFVNRLGEGLAEASPGFDARAFARSACRAGFRDLGLMDRVGRVAEALGKHLLGDGGTGYGEALKALEKVQPDFGGLPGFVFPRFAAMFGLTRERFDMSMDVLARFTLGSSSEFGVRPFIREDPERALGHITRWAASDNHEIRRLASEGARPRLPWGGSIQAFVDDPAPVIALVEGLMEDPSLFVRKSCGNSLNDVTKDHPELFLEFAARHMGGGERTDWVLRRGARTLIKRKHPGAMKLFGYATLSAGGSGRSDVKAGTAAGTGKSGAATGTGKAGAGKSAVKAGADARAGKSGAATGAGRGVPGGRRAGAGPIKSSSLEVSPASVKIGGSAELRYRVELSRTFGGLVRLEYRMIYPPAPGKPAGRVPREKLFFLRETDMSAGQVLEGVRKVSFKDLSIRRQVPGDHLIELSVNGIAAAKATVRLRR
jgi:3-methyladenine DNA glycosylase AlkC